MCSSSHRRNVASWSWAVIQCVCIQLNSDQTGPVSYNENQFLAVHPKKSSLDRVFGLSCDFGIGVGTNVGNNADSAAKAERRRIEPAIGKLQSIFDSVGLVEKAIKAPAPWSPTGVALAGDHIFILEYNVINDAAHKYVPRVRRLGPDGSIATLTAFAPEGR